MRILLVRLMGLGDVASILVPAAYLYRERYPDASITALTYEAGEEIMQLHPEVDDVMAISKAQWPDDLMSACSNSCNWANQSQLSSLILS